MFSIKCKSYNCTLKKGITAGLFDLLVFCSLFLLALVIILPSKSLAIATEINGRITPTSNTLYGPCFDGQGNLDPICYQQVLLANFYNAPFQYELGWLADTYVYTYDDASVGLGSFKGTVVGQDPREKIRLVYTSTTDQLVNKPVSDFEFIEYSFKASSCGAATKPCGEQFYLNVFTRINAASTTYYDCVFTFTPDVGGVEDGDWATVRFTINDNADLIRTFDSSVDRERCPNPGNPNDNMASAADASYVLGTNQRFTVDGVGVAQIFALNMGDSTSGNDGLIGYFDNIVIKMKDELALVYDLEPKLPSSAPSEDPSDEPSPKPTRKPTRRPTRSPTQSPSHSPSKAPTPQPSPSPTKTPTKKPTLAPVQPVATFFQNTFCLLDCNQTSIVPVAQQQYNNVGFPGTAKVVGFVPDCTPCPGALARVETQQQSIRIIIEIEQVPTPDEPDNILKPSEIINFFNSKAQTISTAISEQVGTDIAMQEDVREIEAPSSKPSQSPAPSISQLPSVSLSPTQKYPPSASPSSSLSPTSSPTTRSFRTFQIISSWKFDDSGRNFCLNAMRFRVGRRVKIRPCRDGFRKQMWFLDNFSQLRLRARPNFCLIYKRREIALGRCLDDQRTKRARFIYDQSRGVVYVRKRKRDLYLGIEPDDKYGQVRLFLEGQNDSLTTWFYF